MGNHRSPVKASIVFGETGKSELETVTRPKFVIRGIVNPLCTNGFCCLV